MVCAGRNIVYAICIVLSVCAQSTAVFGKDGKESKELKKELIPNEVPVKFQWSEHNRLTWDDFQGPAAPAIDESAAATHCSIGFKTACPTYGSRPIITVYNSFYTNKSWVRGDAKIPSILEHEQGHFDLCEIYTRILRERMNSVDYTTPDINRVLLNIYAEVNKDYESRQQAYEQETTHGVNIAEQKRWTVAIGSELSAGANAAAVLVPKVEGNNATTFSPANYK